VGGVVLPELSLCLFQLFMLFEGLWRLNEQEVGKCHHPLPSGIQVGTSKVPYTRLVGSPERQAPCVWFQEVACGMGGDAGGPVGLFISLVLGHPLLILYDEVNGQS
jgi:hypothetical protein